MNNMDFEAQIRSIAGEMEYPPTPNIAGSVAARLRAPSRARLAGRTFARSLVLVLVLVASLLVIPPVRAAVVEFIQIGIVRIFQAEPAPLPQETPATLVPVTATPVLTQTALIPLLEEMAGESTLAEAQQVAVYPILLPAYPPDLGEPDRIFVQDADGPMTILVWIDPVQPNHVQMSLHFLPEGSWAVHKFAPVAVQETNVSGQDAVWAVGPYPLRLINGDIEISRMVDGHVLIWENDGITYRLEIDATLEEAVRIAESLQPIP